MKRMDRELANKLSEGTVASNDMDTFCDAGGRRRGTHEGKEA